MHFVRAAASLALCVTLTSACTVSAKTSVGKPGRSDSPSSAPRSNAPKTSVPDTGVPQDGPRRVVSAPTAGGLAKGTGQNAVTDVPVDPGDVRDGMTVVIENYLKPGSADPVLLIALDNVTDGTSERREHLWRGMLDRLQWDGGVDARPVPAGPLGGSVECFLVSLAEDGNVVCGWADDTTTGIALIPNSTLQSGARTFLAMRADIERAS